MSHSIPKFIKIEKRVGETPLEAIKRVKQSRPELKDVKASYAGRLDPQASGELLVLLGDECNHQEKYQNLNKVYLFGLLIGIGTDTGDIMGVIDKFAIDKTVNIKDLENTLQKFIGKIDQKYPLFSSKRIDGLPLWKLAKEGEIEESELPTHEIEIYSLELLKEESLPLEQILVDVVNRVNDVEGNFRQSEIIKKWRDKILPEKPSKQLQLFALKAEVSSGTYIRQLAKDISKELNIPALCWYIHREKIIIE